MANTLPWLMAASGLANIILFFLWRADSKTATEAKFWKAAYKAGADRMAHLKTLISQREVELRVLEAKIMQAYDDKQLADELNGITSLPKD